jgi:hypothetical protein
MILIALGADGPMSDFAETSWVVTNSDVIGWEHHSFLNLEKSVAHGF